MSHQRNSSLVSAQSLVNIISPAAEATPQKKQDTPHTFNRQLSQIEEQLSEGTMKHGGSIMHFTPVSFPEKEPDLEGSQRLLISPVDQILQR